MAILKVPRGDVPSNKVAEFNKFVSPPGFGGDNRDPQPPTFTLKCNLLVGIDLNLPDGGKVPMWIIEDPDDKVAGRTFPSKIIRIPRGALVQADVGCQGGTHTIHWHGIEPTPMNDGVGKHSFEVDGHFLYQFQPRYAGSYFYHCHKNTVLHFEMGLYGLLIIDPDVPTLNGLKPPFVSGKSGTVVANVPGARVVSLKDRPDKPLTKEIPIVDYDVEMLLVPDSIDSRWHSLGHDAFMQKSDAKDPANPKNFTQDGILNDFRPDIFVLTGIPRRINDPTPFSAADSPLFGAVVAPTVKVGQTLLVRVTNADYLIHQITLDIDADVIAMDGRALGVAPFEQYSQPFRLPRGKSFRLTSAMRWDLLVKPTEAATIPVTVEFFNQITGKKLYTARTAITATP